MINKININFQLNDLNKSLLNYNWNKVLKK